MLYTLSGVPREKFSKFPMPRNTAVFGPTFKGEGIIRLDDVTKDSRYGKNAPHKGMPEGHLPVRSYLAVSVKAANGEVLGGLFFGHSQPGVFTAREENVVAAIAAQAASAIANARLYDAEQRARKAAEAAERRTSTLHKIALQLSRAVAAEEACRIVVREVRALFDAPAGGVMLVGPDPVAHRADCRRWSPLGRDEGGDRAASTRCRCAARRGGADGQGRVGHRRRQLAARYPHLVKIRDQVGANTWAAIPMQFEGRTIGAFGFRSTETRVLTTEEEALLLAVGQQCAQAIERARLHDATQAARKEAEEASRAKDEFLAMLGHELRNPLSPIVTALQLMKLRGDERRRASRTSSSARSIT